MIKVIVYNLIEEIKCKTMDEAYKVWSDKMDNLKISNNSKIKVDIVH